MEEGGEGSLNMIGVGGKKNRNRVWKLFFIARDGGVMNDKVFFPTLTSSAEKRE